jgi:outer membrane protein assembly factor BamB
MMNRVAGQWRWVWALAVTLAGVLSAARCGESQERGVPLGVPQSDHPDAKPVIPTTPEATFHLNNDATLRRWLKDGHSRIDAGQFTEGLVLWQRILDRGDDGFVRLRTDGPWLEVRYEVQRCLSELPPSGRATYERLFGAAARQLLGQSIETGRSVYASETLRRYFHTAAGFDASKWLASRWLDQGESRLAARLLERLLTEPAHRERVTPNLLVQAAVTQRLAGNEVRARELFASLGETRIRIGGEERVGAQLNEQLAARRAEPTLKPSHSQEWLAAGGGFGRRAISSGSMPWLKPLWPPVPLTTDRSAIREWLEAQDERNMQQMAVAAEPLVVRGQVIVREMNGLVAFGLHTGRRLWSYPSALPYGEWLPRVMGQAGENNRIGAVRETLVTNSASRTMSSDGRRVFVIDVLPTEGKPDLRDEPANDDSVKRELDVLTQLVALPLEDNLAGDSISRRALAPGSNASTQSEPDASAFRMMSSEARPRPMWTLDGLAAASKLGHRGCGVQFLGPPVIVDDSLFVMGELFSLDDFAAEKNNQICLIAIDGSNGEPLWSQGLVLVDEPFFRPRQRSRRNPVGSPTVADGMLICPTDVGLIVGVDLVTGRQRWVYSYRVGEAERRREYFPEPLGWDGTPTWPVIYRDRVLLLSRFSDELHCLEATTGKLAWRVPRGDAVYIGAVTDDRIVLVGEREVRAIAMPADGTQSTDAVEPMWSHLVGPVTGRGVRAGEDFLVPLKSGRVACLELATGRDRGFAITRTFDPTGIRRTVNQVNEDDENDDQELAPWPGNLIACDDVVVSLGLSHLAVYPQARSKLAELRTQPESVERRLLESELTMLLGSEGSPVSELRSVLKQPLSPELRRQAERQLRESLYLELSREPDQADDLLPQLEKLADTTAERARLLRRVCEVSLPRDPVRTVRAARDLAALSLEHELELDEHGEHVVSLDTWARGYLRQVQTRVESSPAEAEAVDAVLGEERDRLLSASDLGALRQFARLCDDWPQATGVRFRLAELLIERGEFQEAELLLVRDRSSADPIVAGNATVRLLRLWEHVGLYSLAANLLVELEERFGDVELSVISMADLTNPARERGSAAAPSSLARRVSMTGREYVAAFARDSMTWQAFARKRRPDWDVRRIVISEDRSRGGELRLAESFGNGEPRNRALDRAGVGVHLFQTPPLLKPLGDAGWRIVDRDSGVVMGQLPELDRFYPTALQPGSPRAVNHFFPVGGQGRMLGFSLMGRDQEDPAWETSFTALRGTQEFLRVGPVGPGYCVFQSRQHLVMVDPATGRIAWRRELEPHAGLLAESETGLFGDHEALVVFGADQASYSVFETATGRELRRGKFPVEQHQTRRAFGRRLFHMIDTNNGRRMRIWDSLTDRNELDEPLAGGGAVFQPQVTVDGELLLVMRSGRVRVIDVYNSQVKLDVTLPESDVRGTNTLRAFSDRDRYYLNLQRLLDNSGKAPFSYFVSDSLVLKSEVLGDLHAFARPPQPQPLDRSEGPLGEKLWLRVLPQRTILRLDQARLPFLVALSRQQDRTRSDKAALLVEAIDALTGNQIGSCGHVLMTRIVQSQHDPEAARLTLVGLNSRITLDYGRDKQRLATVSDPH